MGPPYPSPSLGPAPAPKILTYMDHPNGAGAMGFIPVPGILTYMGTRMGWGVGWEGDFGGGGASFTKTERATLQITPARPPFP